MSKLASKQNIILKPIIALLLFSITFIPRVLIAPYTSHGYNVKVFEVWIQRILVYGFNFYIQPTQDMLAPDPDWGHDPSFCEYPPIYIYSLWIAGKIYGYLSPQGNPYLLVLLIKLPMIISESILTVLIFSIVSRRKKIISGILAAGMYAVEPFCFFTEGVGAYAEGMTPLFGILSLYMVMERRYYAAAFFFGLAMMVKPIAFIYLFPLLIFMHQNMKLMFIKVLAFAVLPMVIVPIPFLIIEPWNYISAMIWGGFHNLGRRIPTGVIWVNPSFWCFIKYISGDIYKDIAPTQIFFYIIVTGWLWLQIVKRGLNKEKSNIWFVGFTFVFNMMMFLPAAHEKWIYPAYPLLAMSAFLSQSKKIRRFSLWAFLILTVTYFQFIFAPIWSVRYHFESTEVLPPIEEKLQAMNTVSRWLYQWLYSAGKFLAIFTDQPFEFLYTFANVVLFIKLCSIIRESKSDHAQIRLENFRSLPSEKEKEFPALVFSIEKIKSEVNNQLRAFKLCTRNVKDTLLRLEELVKMFKSGEISENMYKLLLEEQSNRLSSSVGEIFKSKEKLEILRARAKIELAKEKISTRDVFDEQESQYLLKSDLFFKNIYSKLPIHEWQKIIDEINNALSSLTIEEELSIIERYLSIDREASHLAESEEARMTKQICQQRLNVLLEKWSSIRRDKIAKIIDLEMKTSQLKDKIKEVEVRFSIGEFDRNLYELKVNELKGFLKRIEKEIFEIRSCINEIDLRIFKISELLTGSETKYWH